MLASPLQKQISMKPTHKLLPLCVMAIFSAIGCSHAPAANGPQGFAAKDLNVNGPTIVEAPYVEPTIVTLNAAMQPTQPAIITTDVKDFKSTITDVHLKFRDIPLEVPMTSAGGTTWRAELNPNQLQMLAVSGKTMHYQADIIARDANGLEQTSKRGVALAVKAPEVQPTVG